MLSRICSCVLLKNPWSHLSPRTRDANNNNKTEQLQKLLSNGNYTNTMLLQFVNPLNISQEIKSRLINEHDITDKLLQFLTSS